MGVQNRMRRKLTVEDALRTVTPTDPGWTTINRNFDKWKAEKRSKYGAIPTVVDGIHFASKKEAKRYMELKIMERIGDIHGLELQPVYKFKCGVKYVGDFQYTSGRKIIVEDVKGVRTPVFRIKQKLMQCEYPEVLLVTV